MKKYVFIFLGLMTAITVSAADHSDTLWEEAGRLYRAGLDHLGSEPEKAFDLFEQSENLYRVVAETNPCAPVYIAMGNAAFLQKKFALAVYCYREAQSFRNSREIRQALSAARLRLNEEIEIPIQQRILENIFFFHYKIPFFYRLIVLLFLWLGISFLGCYGLLKKQDFFYGYRVLLIAVGFLIGVTGISVVVDFFHHLYVREGVLLQDTEGRSGDHLSYDPAYLRSIPAGSEVEIIGKNNGWFHVRLKNRSECWLPEESVSLIGKPLQ